MALRRQNQFLVTPRPGDSSRADGWLDELDEDAIRVDREHESPERTSNRLTADAEETVARARRALEQRVEGSTREVYVTAVDPSVGHYAREGCRSAL